MSGVDYSRGGPPLQTGPGGGAGVHGGGMADIENSLRRIAAALERLARPRRRRST
jgi:hypothetical protein